MDLEKNIIKNIDLSVARRITEKKSRNLGVIPYKEDDDMVYVFVKESNINAINEIKFLFRKQIKEKIITEEEINYITEIIYLGEKSNSEQVVIKSAIDLKASDIHFEPAKEFVYVRLRIDGLLRTMYIFFSEEYLSILSKLKINADLDITDKRKPKDGNMSIIHNNSDYDLRISIIPTVYGEKVVLRVMQGSSAQYSLKNLRVTEKQFKKLKTIMNTNSGLAIVNGPTGSGKSTTLYSILQELNNDEINISTLEDPIEAILPGVNQMNLNKTLNIGFAEGLRSLLRQDPDIVMIGEIRDEETAEMAVRAALTGHKVYSTIHTKNPREVYFRLEDMKVEGYLLRDSLTGIISQRLIRTLCSKCKVEIGEKDLSGLKIKEYSKRGCKHCNYTGYKGRALVASVNVIDSNIKESIKEIYTNNKILSNAEMLENLDELLVAGDISYEDYITFIEKEGLEEFYEKESML